MNRTDSNEIKALLGLISIKGLGSGRIRTLINIFGSASAVWDASLQRLQSAPYIDREIASRIKKASVDKFIQNQSALIDQHGVKLIPFWDGSYPQQLKKIYDPPVLLFFRGDPDVLHTNLLAIVGTRTPSLYGKNITEKLTRELVRQGFNIVSGLANGVDTITHQTVLREAGKTVAVMGSGLDWIYPAANRRLAAEIAGSGVLLSEYPMGTHPDPANFPRRNRIVSGLSKGVLVTEAGIGSGALITAYQALEQNREVFAVPGSIFSSLSCGVHTLIQEGAKLVQSIDDIMGELDTNYTGTAADPVEKLELGDKEKEIYTLLTNDPMHIDTIVQKSHRTASESLATLLALEIKGLVRQMSGKMFIRA